MAQTNLVGAVRVHVRLARLRPAGSDGADHGGGVPDGDRDEHAKARGGPDRPGLAGHWCGGDRDPRRTASRSCSFDANLPAGTLPDGGPFTEAGDKTWRVVPGTTPQVGQGTVKVFRYTVEIENGLDPTMYGGDNAFAQMVDQTLTNPKGWTHNPQFAFVRIDSGKPDFRISLVSPTTVRGGCGYEFRLETSCYNPSFGGMDRQSRVFINEARWVRGAVPFEGDVGSYRQYVINHEVGHAIGYLRHEPCDQQGGLAPVMMQQTFSTSNDDAAKFDPDFVKADGKTCRFNPWPYPIP